MTFSNPIVEAGVVGLAELFRTHAVTAAEATEAYLARIERLDPALGAVTDLDAAGARRGAAESAARWSAGRALSPIDGVPLLIKSNIALMGLPWTAGIGAYRDRVAEADAACVAALKEAGGVILGAVNMHEGALGAETDNPWFGRTHNPHRHGHTPGGSSGGSGAAVAAGLCAAALGTDTLGSVRIPSAYCGVFGHKPALGLVSVEGVTPLSWTLDHVGVHARSARDCAAVLEAMTGGFETADTLHHGSAVAVLDFAGQVTMAPEIAAAFEATLSRAETIGLELHTLRLDGYDFGRMKRLGLLISEAEGYAVHQAMLTEDPGGFSDTFRRLLEWGGGQPAHRLASAYREIAAAAASVRDQLAPYAALLSPTAPQPAFPFGAASADQADLTALADITGMPATAFPVGMCEDGLPCSAQVIAWDEATALALAGRLAEPVGAPERFRG